MKTRHEFEREPSRSRWRVLERCARCGTRRWAIMFLNSARKSRGAFLYSVKKDTYDPWSVGAPECKAEPRQSAAPEKKA